MRKIGCFSQNISEWALLLANMADDGSCFGFKKKTVVMTCIGLCCLALVIWTILVTSSGAKAAKEGEEEKEGMSETNGTIFKEICPLNTSIPLDKLEIAVPVNQTAAAAVKLKPIVKRETKETLCKCLCESKVQDRDILRALAGKRKATQKPGNKPQYVGVSVAERVVYPFLRRFVSYSSCNGFLAEL